LLFAFHRTACGTQTLLAVVYLASVDGRRFAKPFDGRWNATELGIDTSDVVITVI